MMVICGYAWMAYDSCMIVPVVLRTALIQHIIRTVYQGGHCWDKALQTFLDIPTPKRQAHCLCHCNGMQWRLTKVVIFFLNLHVFCYKLYYYFIKFKLIRNNFEWNETKIKFKSKNVSKSKTFDLIPNLTNFNESKKPQ